MLVCFGLIWLAAYFCHSPLITSGVQLNRAECEAACRLHLTIPNWRNIGTYQFKKVRVDSAHYIKSCIGLAVRQVVFTNVQ
jgi:hypothetical protein